MLRHFTTPFSVGVVSLGPAEDGALLLAMPGLIRTLRRTRPQDTVGEPVVGIPRLLKATPPISFMSFP